MISVLLAAQLLLPSALVNQDNTFPTHGGATGTLKTISAIPNARTTFGTQLIGSIFTDEPFINDEKHTRSRLRLSGNYTLPWNIELFGGFQFSFNEHGNAASSRSQTSFFENTDLGAKWSKEFFNELLHLGAAGYARMFSGGQSFRNTSGFSRTRSGPFPQGHLMALASLDFKNQLPKAPLKTHLNLGYRTPNSNLVPPASGTASAELQQISIFNLDAFKYQALTLSLAAEVPIAWANPFIEYNAEYALVPKNDPVAASDNRQSVGVGARFFPHDSVAALIAGEIGIAGDTAGKAVGIPQNTPWEIYFGLAFQTSARDLFESYGDLRGRVVDQDTGLPLPDVTATLIGEVNLPRITDLSGYFSMENLDNGSYRIRFEKSGYQPTTESFEIKEGEDAVLDVSLSTTGPRRGDVRASIVDYESGEPVTRAYVTLSGSETPLTTNEAGEVVARGVEEGTQILRVEAVGYEAQDFEVEIRPGEEIEQTFTLTKVAPTSGNFLGTVKNESGTGLTAVFTSEDIEIQTFGTDPLTGAFDQKLPAGSYTLKVQAENYLPKEIPIELEAGGSVTEEIVLEKPEVATVVEDKIVLPDAIYFEFDSAAIDGRSFEILGQIARILKDSETEGTLKIEGHTDNVGSEDYNQGLSLRRAQAVRDFLIDQGVAANRLEAVGYGETDPIATNLIPEGREENRRVEFNLDRE